MAEKRRKMEQQFIDLLRFIDRGARVAQWEEQSPPKNVVHVHILAVDSICGLLLALSLALRDFFLETSFFPSSRKTNTSK